MRQLIRIYKLNMTPKYSIFGMFRGNQQEQQKNDNPQQEKQENQQVEEDLDNIHEDDMTREQYLRKLTKSREKKEKSVYESRKLEKEYDKIKLKEYQMKFGKYDAGSISFQNINLFPQKFEHPDQLFYYIEKLETRLTEENLSKCVQSFINFSEKLSSDDIERPQFYQFIDILENHFSIISNKENLIQICLFADMFCIDNSYFWENLERRIVRNFEDFTLEEKKQISTFFANQKEGSELFFNKLEKIFDVNLQTLSFKDSVQISANYKKVSFGTVEFLAKLMKHVLDEFDQANFEDLLLLSKTLKDVSKIQTEALYQMIEEMIVNQDLSEVDSVVLCKLAQNFGFEKGSFAFFQKLEGQIDLKNTNLSSILNGFIFNYRGSKELFENMVVKIEENFDNLSTIELVNIVKAYYIVELENEALNQKIEHIVLEKLKDVSFLSVEEIFEVAKSYNMTRLGSRQFYKVLELVIKYRFEDISKNHDIVRGLHALYSKSGLISQKMLLQLESIS